MHDIYNQYVADEKLKEGTKYERLAAIVYKSLNNMNVVLHDLRLSGTGKLAKHQIDITVENREFKKRMLIECKDYDKKIGIGVIRDFHGAVFQIKPDEAMVVTKVGFTKGAIKFAEDEDIKLIILREFNEDDWEGRMRTLHLQLNMTILDTPKITAWDVVDKTLIGKFKSMDSKQFSIRTYDTYFYDKNGEITETFQEVFKPIFNSLPCELGKVNKGNYKFDNFKIIKLSEELVEVQGFSYELTCHQISQDFEFDEGNRLAVLLLKALDGTIDTAIFDDQISMWKFNETGEVVTKNS